MCRCGEADCDFVAFGYYYCRPCEEHHRNGECAIDEEGRALAACGHPWFMCEYDRDTDMCWMKEEDDGVLRGHRRSEDDVHPQADSEGDRRSETVR